MNWIALAVMAIVLVLGSLWMVYELKTAPKGYEDETGFHYGEPGSEE